MDDEKIFMANIAFLRKRHKLTQKEMAEIMGIGLYSIKKMEKGVFPERLGIDAVFRLQHFFKIPAKDLFKKIE